MSDLLDLAVIRERAEARRHLPLPLQRVSLDGAAADIFALCEEIESLRPDARMWRELLKPGAIQFVPPHP